MNCPKCNFVFGDMKPNFCPNCGKKIILAEDVPKNFIRRVDYLRFLDKGRFLRFWENISPLDAEGAYQWLQEWQPNITVFTIEGTCLFELVNWEGEVCSKKEVTHTLSAEEVKEWLTNKHRENCKFKPKKTYLKKNSSPYTYGEKWWWTREECELAIKESIDSAKNG